MKDIPVYLFTGFLGAGKTSFIKETLEHHEFGDDGRTLLLVCENGEVQYEQYVPVMVHGECDIQFPCTVPTGRLFVLSDDRTSVTDSRHDYPGMIALEQVIGRAAMRLLPLKDAGSIGK